MRLTYNSAVHSANISTNIKTTHVSSNITVKVGFGDDMKPLAKIALYNRLYVSGWMLSGYLKSIIDGNLYSSPRIEKCGLALVYFNGVPVSLCLLHGGGELNSFTRKSERRKGFGKLAIKHIEDGCMERFNEVYAYGHSSGLTGCYTFFHKSLTDSRYGT